jgi:predicted transcriptional regulator
MPPEGYTTVTISDELAEKLTRIMVNHDRSSYAEAIEYAVDTTLVQEDEITIRELIQLLADRAQELD